jgi:hypothetical protein
MASADDKFNPIDLQPFANKKLIESSDAGLGNNNLAALPKGEQVFDNVKFQIGKSLIELSGNLFTNRFPDKVEGIKVNEKLAKLHILHATEYTVPAGTLIGEYRINFNDHSAIIIPIVSGDDVCDWWDWWSDNRRGDPKISPRIRVVWEGDNGAARGLVKRICLFMTTWENPWPDKTVESIDYSSKTDVASAPFCVAITAEMK